jgi:hypothetical protein
MNLCGVARPLRLEQLPRSLTGKRSDESAQMLVTLRVDLVVRVRANVRPMLSPPLAPMPSSFGHDTPAHVERRCRFRARSAVNVGSTECGSHASTTDRRGPWTA